jgi:hypothetical protein
MVSHGVAAVAAVAVRAGGSLSTLHVLYQTSVKIEIACNVGVRGDDNDLSFPTATARFAS